MVVDTSTPLTSGAGGGEQPKGSAGAKADLANPLARAGREQLDGDAIDVGGLGSPDPSQ